MRCFRRTYEHIVIIQRRLSNFKILKQAKFDILSHQWNRIHHILTMQGSKTKNEEMLAFSQSVARIGKSIKTHILRQYLKACDRLQQIAFFQWRLKMRPQQCNQEVAEYCIQRAYFDIMQTFEKQTKISMRTKIEGEISSSLERALGIAKSKEEKPWLINSFADIGWLDPFPAKKKNTKLMPFERRSLVYNENRYRPDQNPLSIYVPSKRVLITMMRACMGVDKVE